jgi:co-chaperonin GroES (HSP10)
MRASNQIQPLSITSNEFKPLGSQFLGKYIMETESAGGILMPEQDTWWAEVFVVGPDCTIKPGEKALMSKYRGDNINFKNGSFTIFNETDALCAESV